MSVYRFRELVSREGGGGWGSELQSDESRKLQHNDIVFET